MAQFGRPDGDILLGSWSPYPSSPTTLFDKIDEETPNNDTDYIVSSIDEDECEVSLGDVTDPGVGTGHVIRCYAKSPAGGQAGEQMWIALVENGTIRGQSSVATINRTAYGLIEYTLSEAEADAIQNYSNLRLRFHITKTDPDEPIRITQAELEVPDAGQNIIKVIDEAEQLSEGIVRLSGLCRLIDETLQIGEGILRIRTLARIIGETLQINEGIVKFRKMLRQIDETLQIQENIARLKKMVRQIDETLQLSETISKVLGFVRVVDETFQISEGIIRLKGFVKQIDETLNIQEGILRFRNLARIISETLNLQENISRLKKMLHIIGENVSISEGSLIRRSMTRIINETVQLVENIVKKLTSIGGPVIKVINEAMNISEGIIRLSVFQQIGKILKACLEKAVNIKAYLGKRLGIDSRLEKKINFKGKLK